VIRSGCQNNPVDGDAGSPNAIASGLPILPAEPQNSGLQPEEPVPRSLLAAAKPN